MIKALCSLVLALPDILRLLQTIEAAIQRERAERKLKDDIKAINDAFASRDAGKLNHIFNSDARVPIK
jgi:hypothetical protein